jgi:hypothetical protein
MYTSIRRINNAITTSKWEIYNVKTWCLWAHNLKLLSDKSSIYPYNWYILKVVLNTKIRRMEVYMSKLMHYYILYLHIQDVLSKGLNL